MGRAFASSYLAGEPPAHAFFAPAFRDRNARIARTRAAAARGVSAELLSVLAEQQAALPASPSRRASLEALASGKAAAVITGQQVGLFLGPLYTYYKAASAIAVARALADESGVPCVPVFWLQTEDHDFAEIRFAMVADGEGAPRRLELAEPPEAEARVSVAHRVLPAQIEEVLAALAQALGDAPAAGEVVRLLRTTYRPGVALADAFAATLASLFADQGLLIFNPRDARIAGLARPLYGDCIADAQTIEADLRAREQALAAVEIDAQVPVREQGALLFFHRDSPAGPRFRLQRGASTDPQQATWRLAGSGQSISQAELDAALAREPLRFSTSALLRPILQDRLFPTAAYVAGPGEINYFAQLGPLYARAGLVPPLLVPRARVCVVDARSRRRLGQLGLRVGDLTLPAHVLRSRVQASRHEGEPSVDQLRQLVATKALPILEEVASAVDRPGLDLARAAERTRKSVRHAFDRLLDRYARMLFERDTVVQRRIGELERALAPTGVAQERFYAWPWLAGRIGVGALADLVMRRLTSNPFATEVHEIDV